MTQLEARIRSGLRETAERIPESGTVLAVRLTKPGRPVGVWMGVAAVFAVLVLFSPLVFLDESDPAAPPGETSTPSEPPGDEDVTPAAVGFEFANPEHVRLRFTQDLTLTCQGLETVDNGGFNSFSMDIWIDHEAGYTRLGIEYPDGSTHDLILKGRPGVWEQAWGYGTDLGLSAGCRENLGDGAYNQSVAGWAFQDASELWFTAYLKPVSPDDGGVVINHEGNPTHATAVAPQTYIVETLSPDGTQIRYEFTLDEAEIRVMGEHRYIHVPDEFEANATIEVSESGPAPMPTDIFDTSTFTPLWGGNPVATTEATTP